MKKPTKKIRIAGIALLLLITLGSLYSLLHIDNYPDKLWLHRCNSVEKYAEMHERYPNVEIDVVFRGDHRFDVTHDYHTTFHLPVDSILKKSHGGGYFWLDIKNLDSLNRYDILDEMKRLCKQYDLSKQQFILESPNWKQLGLFTEQGYYTSCYVPYEKPSRLDEGELSHCIKELQKVADSDQVCALSFPGWWYTSLKKHLNRDIDLLTWKHRTTQFEFFLTPIGWRMLRDSQLKVILIKDKGQYHR